VTGDDQARAASRFAALREIAVVAGLAGLALWIIPQQTVSGPVLGLPPAFLPKVCAIAILTLALVALAYRLWRPEPLADARLAPPWPAALIIGVVLAATAALQFAGPIASGLVAVALGLVVLGEKRLPVIASTLIGTATVLAAIFQPWR
jgi:hypothetical protein